ncbi:cell division protein FtsK [Cytobacillus sp. IB215665]|uniref:cell division protein FtsK n=1 Tax=Cytobacillus sp. IB215665 TaxID=3097357 RepID=UPI002A0D3E25|nr:cell division protein FtsK [Cytobacillus sp. IB215665]MDX8364706.1 cell division protein FtsK [Cytobacillus sp. IB215665]
MSNFKRTIVLLNTLKQKIYKYEDEGLSSTEQASIEKIKRTNPYGLIVMTLGGISFAFGYKLLVLPIVTLMFGIIAYGTFEKASEDNPWTFYIGLILALIGLYMYVRGFDHKLII